MFQNRIVARVVLTAGLIVAGFTLLPGEAQAQYRRPTAPSSSGYGPRYYGQSPSGRYYAPPKKTYTPPYRAPSPYKPGGSLYSPFNPGSLGTGGGHYRR